MGLAVIVLRKMAALALLILRQAAESVPLQRLVQHLTADDPPRQLQNLPHRCFQTFVRQLAEDQLRFQRVQLPPENNSGVILHHQKIPV